MDRFSYDVIVVGGGAAGLRAALEAAAHKTKPSVAVVSKVYPMRSHTVSAEGGTAAVLREHDSFDSHSFDTIKGSDYLADQDAVEFFVREAPKEVIRLDHWGCPFTRDEDGRLAQRAFGGMSVKRTVFAGDKIGFHILHTLLQRTMLFDNITRHDEWFVTSLITSGTRVRGLTALELKTGELGVMKAKAVILATGGCGRVYEFTTNGWIKTGDGMALACRAGAYLKDMEFVQFHPTALPGTGILMTEAARGEGGYLLNKDNERFLKRYVPEKMELGPRDVISRAILTEISERRGLDGPYGSYVLLDLRHLGRETIEKKLPFLKELAEKYAGISPLNEPIPVRPAQHYMMGGISIDASGRTVVAGLYAAGEAACVSINGANRLGSNSLSECLVFGASAGRHAAEYAANVGEAADTELFSEALKLEEKRIHDGLLKRESGKFRLSDIREEMRRVNEAGLSVFRREEGMRTTLAELRKLRERFRNETYLEDSEMVFNTELISALELDFMLEVSEHIAVSALLRRESRGAHYRLDKPSRDDENFLQHTLTRRGLEGPEVEYLPVTITKWKPAARVY